jgi:hypothetical protein
VSWSTAVIMAFNWKLSAILYFLAYASLAVGATAIGASILGALAIPVNQAIKFESTMADINGCDYGL